MNARDRTEQRGPDDRRADQRSRQRRPAAAQPEGHRDRGQHRQQVGEPDPQGEPQAELPGRGRPAGHDLPGPSPAVAADQQEQRQRHRPGGEHVEVAVVGHLPGRPGVRRRGHGRGGHPAAQLPGEQAGRGEGEGVRQQQDEVVADDGGDRAVPDEGERRVAEQAVGEGEAALGRPGDVALEQRGRRGGERVAAPGEEPRLAERVAGVLRDAGAEVAHQRPGQQDGERGAGGQPAGPLEPGARRGPARRGDGRCADVVADLRGHRPTVEGRGCPPGQDPAATVRP